MLRIVQTFFSRMSGDRLSDEASSLTYQTFLAIVPLLAVMFGIAKGFGFDDSLQRWLTQTFGDQREMLDHLLSFSQTTLQEARGGIIAGVGTIFLLFTSIRMLSSVELSFNTMWGGEQERSWSRQVSDYLTILVICPFLLVISSSITVFITTRLMQITESVSVLTPAQPVLAWGLQMVPFFTSALLFTIFLYSLPCAPVRLIPAIVSGVVASVFFQMFQSWYVYLQLQLTLVGTIYGSFVAIPLFLVWLWVSWFIVLFSGELLVFLQEKGWERSIYLEGELSALELDILVLTTLHQNGAMFISELYTLLPVAIRAITASVHRLSKRGIVYNGNYQTRIFPALPLQTLSLSDLVLADLESPSGRGRRELTEVVERWRVELKGKEGPVVDLFSLQS